MRTIKILTPEEMLKVRLSQPKTSLEQARAQILAGINRPKEYISKRDSVEYFNDKPKSFPSPES